MKLCELDISNEYTSDPVDVGLEYNQVYTYNPKLVRDQQNYPRRIFTIYSFKEKHTGKKSYAIEGDEQISIKVLKDDHLKYKDERIQKVRIVSNVDVVVSRFSLVHNDFTRNEYDELISFKLKELPDFDNYDMYSDEEFFKKFGRAKLADDKGLVGYVFIHELPEHTHAKPQKQQKPQQRKQSGGWSPEEEDDNDSKMDAARMIYQSSHHLGRKRVLHKFVSQLGLTQNGASSYYTRIKHEFDK